MAEDRRWRWWRRVVMTCALGAALGGLVLAVLLLGVAGLTGVRVVDSSPSAALHLLLAACCCCLLGSLASLVGVAALWGSARPGWRWPLCVAGGAFTAAGGCCGGAALTGWAGDEAVHLSLGLACLLLALATPWWSWGRGPSR